MNFTTSRLLSAFAMLALALTAVGCSCGGDDYYCDDSGCYYCDGLGCRNADAPPRADCTGDFQCEAGELCTAEGCTPRCSLDEECADGTICIDSGFCLPPGSGDPILTPGVCATSEECGDGGLCQDGMCIADPADLPDDGGGNPDDVDPGTDPNDPGTDPNDPGTDPSDPGTDPSDPGNGGEIPVGPAPQCTVESDCTAGWDCVNAICKLGCTQDSQCGPGCSCNEDGWCSGQGFDE